MHFTTINVSRKFEYKCIKENIEMDVSSGIVFTFFESQIFPHTILLLKHNQIHITHL